MTRYIALLRAAGPLGGLCPACERPLDDGGCRIAQRLVSLDPGQTRGIAQIIEVWCSGMPTMPMVECPNCVEAS